MMVIDGMMKMAMMMIVMKPSRHTDDPALTQNQLSKML